MGTMTLITPPKKVRLEKASASEIASSLKITPREARLAKAAVKFVLREARRPSLKTTKLRAAKK
jgi:hypothetical protein